MTAGGSDRGGKVSLEDEQNDQRNKRGKDCAGKHCTEIRGVLSCKVRDRDGSDLVIRVWSDEERPKKCLPLKDEQN